MMTDKHNTDIVMRIKYKILDKKLPSSRHINTGTVSFQEYPKMECAYL